MNNDETVLPREEVRKKGRKKFAWPEGVDRKTIFFGYSSHTNAVRYVVCGVYNEERNSFTIGVTRTDGIDNFCRADGRTIAYKRAVGDSNVEIAVKGRPQDYFRYMLNAFSTPAMVIATITREEREERERRRQAELAAIRLRKEAAKLVKQQEAEERRNAGKERKPIHERVVNMHVMAEEVDEYQSAI